jgi:hypothetical protein
MRAMEFARRFANLHAGCIGKTVEPAVPWIWSAIEFDSQGNFVSLQHAIFPTYSV